MKEAEVPAAMHSNGKCQLKWKAVSTVKSMRSQGETGAYRLAPPLRSFLVVLAGLTGLCVAAELVCTFLLHRPEFPYRWPLLPRMYAFGDLTGFRDRFVFFHSPRFFDAPPGTPPLHLSGPGLP